MPLHLLGKKSWNVYNAENVARVRRDEAAAVTAEQATEQRMQEVDAARRLAILRGETPPPLPEPEPEIDPSDKKHARHDRDRPGFVPRKRKRAGEDDTDFEMRLARERAEVGDKVAGELVKAAAPGRSRQADADIVDRQGHIDLIGAPPAAATEKNPEYEREAAKKKREMEDQYTMRFSNAAGRDGLAAGAPWYAKVGGRKATAAAKEELDAEVDMEVPTKDVWGNDDPRRKVREAARLNASDPLAMMKMGAKKVREMEKERKRDVEERGRELKALRREQRTREKRRRKERAHDDEGEEDAQSRSHSPERSERSERSDRRRSEDGRRGHQRRLDNDYERRRDRYRDRQRGRERSSHSRRDAQDRHRDRRRHNDGSDREA